jgi:cytochrome c2
MGEIRRLVTVLSDWGAHGFCFPTKTPLLTPFTTVSGNGAGSAIEDEREDCPMKQAKKTPIALVFVLSLAAFAFSAWSQSAGGRSSMSMLEGKLAADGAIVLQKNGCTNCHSFDNRGRRAGPDLGSDRIRGKSPSALAAAMWNHAPTMWRSIGSDQVPTVDGPEAAALFAFFFSRLYFEDPLNSTHGEDVFKSRCGSCHDLQAVSRSTKAGPPASTWLSIKDPIALVSRMWNHSTNMLDQVNRQGKSWPRLSGQDTRDLVGYLWRMPELTVVKSPFQFGDDAHGREVFNQDCARCHSLAGQPGLVDLSQTLRRTTMLQFAASMWNHAPAMKLASPGVRLPVLDETAARDLVTYLVVARAFEEIGDSKHGEMVYRTKNCASCHEKNTLVQTAPRLSQLRGPFNAVRLTSALWSHGPRMLEAMKRANLPWPHFAPDEMLDLLAFLSEKTEN